MEFQTIDQPTYAEFGKIYPGDYYKELPFGKYISPAQEVPQDQHVYDIRDFGARPDSEYLSTAAFHEAAKACEKAGGGTILVAGGSYRMGTVWIPSNTTLFIAADGELAASRDVSQFDGGFIRADGVQHIRITGGGRISGNGEWFVYEPRELPMLSPYETTILPRRDQAERINTVPGTVRYFYRQRIRYAEDKYQEGKPRIHRPSFMVWLKESTDVVLDNIVLHDSMAWTLNLDCCMHVTVRNLVIDDNRHVANTDGIDITGSSDVQIEHCFISCADDGIVVKNPAYTGRSMEQIRIKDCTVITVMNAFKIGTETGNDIRDVLAEDCDFRMPDLYPGSVSGISLESCDGTRLSDVRIRNITMNRILCPIYICLNRRNRYGDPYTDKIGENRYWGGCIQNIVLEQIKASDAELPCILTGFVSEKKDGTPVRRPVEDVTIADFEMIYRDNKEQIMVPDVIEEFIEEYPESNAHGDVDACGIWARHVDNLTLENIRVVPRSCNTRDTVRLHDVTAGHAFSGRNRDISGQGRACSKE